MNRRTTLGMTMALALALMIILPTLVFGEVIQLRTGQVGGVPGTCPNLDDSFRYDPVGLTPCGQPFRAGSFAPADFAAADAGPPAVVVTPFPGVYLPSLPSDPLATWINWQAAQNCTNNTPNSILYSCPFTVHTNCNPTATIRVCWAVDDLLGDPVGGGPNPVGIYLNGVPLNIGFSGGNRLAETCYVQANVPVNTGLNHLYVYQRDVGCAISQLMLSATITVTATTCPDLSVFKFNDLNGNGVQDPGEPPLPGWTFNVNGPASYSGTTDANGSYFIHCLPTGTYTVTEVTQPGWVVTTPPGGSQQITLDCGLSYVVNFGNRQCDQQPGQSGCVPLPSCLTAWFPFDECSGTTANEVVANRDGTIIGGSGNPTWGGGRWGSACGIQIPGVPGTNEVLCPNCPEHNLGTGSFTLFAWIKATATDGFPHSILDKRVLPVLTPTGYALYYRNGRLEFQYGDGVGAATTYFSTGPLINDGNWHTVGVSVCRNPNTPATNTATLFVDGYSDVFTGTNVRTGNLSNSAGLTMGDQCPGFFTGIPFLGAIDDAMIFKCCLTQSQILALRTDLPYCHQNCYVPSIRSSSGGTVTTSLTLCNYSLAAHTYTWTIAGLPAGTGCSVNGPTSFSPASGTVTIPAAVSGPVCVNIPITITMPPGMTFGQTACYQVTTMNANSGRCCTTQGRIRKSKPIIWWDPVAVDLPVGVPTTLRLRVTNDDSAPLDFAYTLAGNSADGDPSNQVVSLNGLPPGVPVLGTLMVAPGTTGVVEVEALLDAFQPLNINEVVASGDVDGDGVPDDLDACALNSVSVDDPAGVPQGPAAAPQPTSANLFVAPNPFDASTSIRLSLARPLQSVRVEIFNVGGQRIRQIFAGPLQAGPHPFVWDGLDDHGRQSGSGLFFLRARSVGLLLQTKLIRTQ
jgi:hypothetical protein